MTKATKIALYGVPIAIGIYLIYRQLRKSKGASYTPYTPPVSTTTPPSLTGGSGGSGSTGGLRSCGYPLKKGDYDCAQVKYLQFILNNIPRMTTPNTIGCERECGLRPLKEDGDFGDKTERLLKDTFGIDNISESQLKDLEAEMVLDPVEFQRRENPFVSPPAPTTPTTTPTFPFTTF